MQVFSSNPACASPGRLTAAGWANLGPAAAAVARGCWQVVRTVVEQFAAVSSPAPRCISISHDSPVSCRGRMEKSGLSSEMVGLPRLTCLQRRLPASVSAAVVACPRSMLRMRRQTLATSSGQRHALPAAPERLRCRPAPSVCFARPVPSLGVDTSFFLRFLAQSRKAKHGSGGTPQQECPRPHEHRVETGVGNTNNQKGRLFQRLPCLPVSKSQVCEALQAVLEAGELANPGSVAPPAASPQGQRERVFAGQDAARLPLPRSRPPTSNGTAAEPRACPVRHAGEGKKGSHPTGGTAASANNLHPSLAPGLRCTSARTAAVAFFEVPRTLSDCRA